MSAPWLSERPVVMRPMTAGRFLAQMVASASTTLPSAPRTVVSCSIAVVCSAMGSRKCRIKNSLLKDVQPRAPCSSGIESASPRKASDAPIGWLAFSGFTASALVGRTISAIGAPKSRLARPGGRGANLLPHGRVHRAVEVLCQLDQAVITGVADAADVIYVEEGDARLERGIDIAVPGDQNVCLAIVEGFYESGLIVIGDHERVSPHQCADACLVLLGRFLGACGSHNHAEIPHSRYNRPGFVAASEDQHALAGEALAQRCQLCLDPALLAGDDRFSARAKVRIAESLCEVAEGL